MKKVLIAIAIVVALLIAAAIAAPLLFKDKIARSIKQGINESLTAKVDFGNFGLSFLRSLPYASLCIENLSVVGTGDFDGDTLAFIKELDVRVNLWDVMGGSQMKVRSVILDHPYINILVLKDGKANYDITKPSSSASTSSSSSFKLALQSYALKDGRISYDDQSVGFKMKMNGVNHSGSGDFTQDLFTLKTKTDADAVSAWYGGIRYLTEAKTKLDADIDMDMKQYKFTFKNNELTLNALTFGYDGWFAMPGSDYTMDIKWNAKQSDFGSFVSMIPGIYSASFKNLKSSGKLAMNGFVKGTYNDNTLPAFGLTLKVDNGMFQYPSLPTAVKDVNIDLNVNNPDGITDHTVINLKQLHALLGDAPIDARLYVTTPVSDANIDGMLKGTVDLAKIKTLVPLDQGTDLNGIVSADVTMKGRYSAIASQQYQNFNAAGTLSITGMQYKDKDAPATVINNLLLTFNPANITLSQLDARLGKSDIKATGTIDNLLGYYFNKELLKGSFNMNSSLLDLNEWMTGATAASTTPDTSSMTVIAIPSNIDFAISTTVNKILYENFTLQNLKGSVRVHEQKLDMSNLFFNMLNGSVTMSGTYATVNPAQPGISYTLSLKNFDISQTANAFSTIEKMAPIARQCNGSFSSDLTVKGNLDAHMQPVMTSLNGKGVLTSQLVTVKNFEPLNKMADALKMDQYRQMSIPNLNASFEFSNGRVKLSPLKTDLDGSTATISGTSGLDQTIDYKLNLSIPKSKIPAAATSALTAAFAKANSALGSNFQLPDPVNINVSIGGTVMQPVIKTGAENGTSSLANTAKEAAQEQVQQQVDHAKAQASAQADKILADANKQAQAIRDAAKASSDKARAEGYAAADKLVAQATNPIAKSAAQAAAKKAKAETDKKCQQIIDDGNKKAQAVLDAAQKQADDLLK